MPRATSDDSRDPALEAAFTELSGRLTTNVRKLRARRGLTQAALAERANVGVRYIAMLEMASAAPNLSLKALAALACALDCDARELLQAGPQPNPRTPGRPRARKRTRR